MSSSEDSPEIVRFYTRARRFPQLIGKTPDGFKLPGGPYTYTQAMVGAAMLWLGSSTFGMWGRFGLIGNFIVLIAVTYAVVFALGQLPMGGRSPLSAATGLLRAYSTSSAGHLAGRPFRPRSPRRLSSLVMVQVPVSRRRPRRKPAADPSPSVAGELSVQLGAVHDSDLRRTPPAAAEDGQPVNRPVSRPVRQPVRRPDQEPVPAPQPRPSRAPRVAVSPQAVAAAPLSGLQRRLAVPRPSADAAASPPPKPFPNPPLRPQPVRPTWRGMGRM